MKLLILFSVLAVGALALNEDYDQNDEIARFDKYRVHRVVPQNVWQLTLLKVIMLDSSYTFWREPEVLHKEVDVMVPPRRRSAFKLLLLVTLLRDEVLIENVQELIDEEAKEIKKRAHELDWETYHSLDEFEAWMVVMNQSYSNVNKIVVGKSYWGRNISALEITFDKSKPTVFMESGIHGREWIAPAATSFAVNEIINSNQSSIFRKFNYIYVPILNPDGYNYSWTTDRMWLKNRNPHTVLHWFGCNGVDLDRNWDYNWIGHRFHCFDTYPGPEPFSEIETKSVSEYLQANAEAKKIDLYLNFHSYYQLLMYPSAPNKNPASQHWAEIANNTAEAFKTVNNTELKVGGVNETLYPPHGTSLGWFSNKFNPSVAFNYHLRDTGKYGFLLPGKYIKPSGKELTASIAQILEDY